MKLKNVLATLMIVLSFNVFAQESSSDDMNEKRRAIIKYGTESQIEKLCKSLAKDKITDMNTDLASLFASTPSIMIKIAVLDLFSELEDATLGEASKKLLSDYSQNDNPLNLSAIKYLGKIKDATASDLLIDIINNSYNDALSLESAQSLGACNPSKETAEFLLSRATEAISNGNYMGAESYITAMANTKNDVIAETMISILANTDNPNNVRGKVVKEMGNYINPLFPPELAKAFQTKDVFLKAAVLVSLSKYPSASETKTTLEIALRDDAWRLRLTAIQSFAEMKDSSIVEHIIYIAKNDKENNVKKEAYKALGKIASSEASTFLKDTFRNEKISYAQRLEAYQAMQDMESTLLMQDAIDAITKQKTKTKMPNFEKGLVNVIGKAEKSQDDFYELFLNCADKDVINTALNAIKRFKLSKFKSAVEETAKKNPDYAKKCQEIIEGL